LRKVLLFSPWDTWAAARLPARMQLLKQLPTCRVNDDAGKNFWENKIRE